jgi:transposase-like protein
MLQNRRDKAAAKRIFKRLLRSSPVARSLRAISISIVLM